MNLADRRVLVTGANGFIGSWIVARLLDAGARVRGTVRDAGKQESVAHLLALPSANRLELVSADLLAPGAFAEPCQDCEAVIHCASPYVIDAKDPQADLVDPAVKGTVSVLEAAAGVPSVQRVVLTSSMAAITDEPESDRVLTEDDWNEKSSLERNPYYFSKAEAERAAWAFMESHRPAYDLVAINPFMVIGPSLSPGLNTSNQIIVDVLTGVYPGVMSLTWGFTDVRDVALAHVRALEVDEAQGRYLCAGAPMTMRELVEILREAGYRDWKLPRLDMDCAVGDFVVKLSSYMQPKGVGTYLRTHVGRTPRYSTAKIERDLGLAFKPGRELVLETVRDIERHGHLKRQ